MQNSATSATGFRIPSKEKVDELVAREITPPSVYEVKFNCPHCGAFSAQQWYNLYAEFISTGERLPFVPPPDAPSLVRSAKSAADPKDAEAREAAASRYERLLTGKPFLLNKSGYRELSLENLFASRCFACGDVAIWLRDSLIYPPSRDGPEANPDLPADVRRDYDEASTIVALSPRGAAALLRLAIQKLCIHLGGNGDDLNKDIASLVTKGLPPLVQKALDGVRVIGNEAVHPGTLELSDDQETVIALFGLVNVIAQQMISIPNQVQSVYGMIPAAKQAGIEARDKQRGR